MVLIKPANIWGCVRLTVYFVSLHRSSSVPSVQKYEGYYNIDYNSILQYKMCLCPIITVPAILVRILNEQVMVHSLPLPSGHPVLYPDIPVNNSRIVVMGDQYHHKRRGNFLFAPFIFKSLQLYLSEPIHFAILWHTNINKQCALSQTSERPNCLRAFTWIADHETKRNVIGNQPIANAFANVEQNRSCDWAFTRLLLSRRAERARSGGEWGRARTDGAEPGRTGETEGRAGTDARSWENKAKCPTQRKRITYSLCRQPPRRYAAAKQPAAARWNFFHGGAAASGSTPS